jgi:hypothetical protein
VVAPEKALEFMNAVEALLEKGPDGKRRTRLDDLRRIVASDGDLAVALARSYAGNVRLSRGYGQMALAIAHAYELEFGDDSLRLVIRRELDAAGCGDINFETAADDSAPVVPAPPERKVVHADIGYDELMRGDIFPIQRLLSADVPGQSALDARRATRGLLMLGFPLDNDPREVWQVPEARTFVSRLFESMPYFPFYLHPDPKLGTARVFFSCLADAEAFVEGGGLNLMHRSVISAVVTTLVSVAQVAGQLGVSEDEAIDQVLSLFPEEYRNFLVTTIAKLEE